jgi:hypothetical protein
MPTQGGEMLYVREEMGLGEVTVETMARHLGVTPAELAEMEAGARAVPDGFFGRALEYIGMLSDRDEECERKAHLNLEEGHRREATRHGWA